MAVTPKKRNFGDDLAPTFALVVEGTELKQDLAQWVDSVEFESSIDMADMMTVTLNNPNDVFSEPTIGDATAHKAFQPGNHADLYGGYGRANTHIGRAIWTKHLPEYPDSGMATLQVKGYSPSYLMMNPSSAEISSTAEDRINLAERSPVGKRDNAGRIYVYPVYRTAGDVVRKKAKEYNFDFVVDDSGLPELRAGNQEGIIQKKGTTDYQLIQMLANLHRREFYVRFDPSKKRSVLYWVKPKDQEDDPIYTFEYGTANASLFSCRCEYGIKDTITSVVALAYDPKKQEYVSVIEAKLDQGPDPKFVLGGGRMERQKAVKVDDPGVPKKKSAKAKKKEADQSALNGHLITQALRSAPSFRLEAGGIAIDIVPRVHFESAGQLGDYAVRWLAANRDAFLVMKGTIIGVEDVRAGQVHTLNGIGPRLSGDYYFIAAKHRFQSKGLYTIDFTARKILK